MPVVWGGGMREIVNEAHRLEPWTNTALTYGERVTLLLQEVQSLHVGVPDAADVILSMLDEAVMMTLVEELGDGSERRES